MYRRDSWPSSQDDTSTYDISESSDSDSSTASRGSNVSKGKASERNGSEAAANEESKSRAASRESGESGAPGGPGGSGESDAPDESDASGGSGASDGESDASDGESYSESDSDPSERFPFEDNLFRLCRLYDFTGRLSTSRKSIVYKAKCRATGEWRAVKLNAGYSDRKPPREARLLSVVQGHPNVTKFTCWHPLPETGCHAIVTDLVPNQAEDVDVALEGKPDQVRSYVRQLLCALQHLHSRGVLYRDVRMSNVLWDHVAERVTLIDFDVATFFDASNLHRVEVGTDGYMAPEVVTIGKITDVWEDIVEHDDECRRAARDMKNQAEPPDPHVQERREGESERDRRRRERRVRARAARDGLRLRLKDIKGYGLGVDVYGAGMILAQLLFGVPENDVTDDDMPECKGHSFVSRAYRELKTKVDLKRKQALKLVIRMLEPQAERRITLDEALAHTYFVGAKL
jgi:serine/threonine protein kinase